MTKISSIRIEAFRGIPGRLDVDLCPRPDAEPASLLLYGENGSGKSTVADGLEFLLRASLLRRIDPARPTKRHAKSFAASQQPYVEASLSTGIRLARGNPKNSPFGQRFEDLVQKVENPRPEFSVAPLVLRRADIVGFWNLDDSERKLVFFDYFRTPGAETNSGAEAVKAVDVLDEEIRRTAKLKRLALERLADATGIPEAQIPKDPRRHRNFRRELVRKFGLANQAGGLNGIRPDVSRAWEDFRDTSVQLGRAERARRLNADIVVEQKADRVVNEIQEILATAETSVTESFLSISNASEFVDEISFRSDPDSNRLEVRLQLTGGNRADPLAVLSEANLDLLAFLIYCAIIEASAEHGQAKVLVLDDVFQSVDAGYRQKACQEVVSKFSDWQLIVTTHDRLWFAILNDAFRGAGKPIRPLEIVDWTFAGGPVLRDATLDPARSLKRAMQETDVVSICAHAGLLLEETADRLSWTLSASVIRRIGDRYTLGDLWPGVAKRLRKTSAKEVAKEVSGSIVYRNLVGAHFNEWARTLPNSEATQFGSTTLRLFESVHCDECQQWIRPATSPGLLGACPCGSTSLRSG